MAINPSDTITYGELIDNIITWIPTICKNIDSYSSDIHASVKPNYSGQPVSMKKDWEYRYAYNGSGYPTRATHYRTTFVLTMTTKASTIIPVVTLQQLSTDLDNFLQARNLIQRSDAIVTTSGLLNIWNNVACFLYKHLVNVTCNFIPNESYLMYWSASPYNYGTTTNMTDFNLDPSETNISALDINDMLKTLKETYNPTWRIHVVSFSQTLNDSTVKLEECAPFTYNDDYVPGYTPDQVLLETSTPGTFNFYLDANANYQIICVGAGGGGSSSRSDDAGTGACGGSGGYSNQIVTLSAGTYAVSVGAGGQPAISWKGYAPGSNGGDTYIATVIGGGGSGGVSNYNGGYAKGGQGGSGTTQNGNNGGGESTTYTASVYGDYGKGGWGYGDDRLNAVAGTSGYIKIVFKNL